MSEECNGMSGSDERTQALVPGDREKLHVHIPFEEDLFEIRGLQALIPMVDDIQADITDLQGALTDFRPQVDSLGAQTTALDAQTKAIEAQTKALQAQTKTFQACFTSLQQSRMITFIANSLIDLARMMAKQYKPDLVMEPSISRLQQFTANLNDIQLQEMGVPQKFWSPLRRLEEYVTIENHQSHETRGEFAQLLSDKQFKESQIFEKWQDIFPLLYGESVEVIAARQEEEDYEMKVLFGIL